MTNMGLYCFDWMCFCLCVYLLSSLWLLILGDKHRQKVQRLKRGSAAGASTALRAAPVVRAGILSDLESLSAGMAGNALLRSEHASTRPSNDSSGDSGPHRRSKRFLSYPRFVEVMVVADSKMVEHHGSNLQHYILTLMSIVSVWFWAACGVTWAPAHIQMYLLRSAICTAGRRGFWAGLGREKGSSGQG